MPFSNSINQTLGYVAETTWGTTPATPTIKLVRFVSNSLKTNTTSTESNEVSTGRESPDVIRTKVSGTGQFGFELSYGSFDDIIEALLGGTWATNVLKVGAVKRSFTFERANPDITQYEVYRGAVITGMSLNVQMGSIIDGTVSFISKAGVLGVATIATATTPVSSTSVMNPIDHIQLIQDGGAGSVTGVTGFTLNIAQEPVVYDQVNGVDPADIQFGKINVSGTINVYKQDAALATKYGAWTTSSLQFGLGAAAATRYNILLGKVKYTEGGHDNGGPNNPLVEQFSFKAFKDAATSTIQVTRVP